MTKQELKNEVAIGKLEVQVKNLDVSVNKIMDNHLPHIQTKLETIEIRFDGIEKKLAYWAGSIAVLTGGLQIILKFFF